MTSQACKKAATFLGILLLLFISVSGCRLGYILHAATGQARLLWGAVPLEDGLKDPALGPDPKERLRLVKRIKAFGVDTLGLRETDSYETVYLKSPQPPVYLVSACPKDSLNRTTWWFPVVGRMPYLGFFKIEDARAEKNRLMEKDLDVYLGRADAYSTLGWFKDPVTRNLIEGSTPDLVEAILHEMTHTTLYVKGQGEFNEGLAMVVGKEGARLFLETAYGRDHPLTREAERSIRDERLFSHFMDTLLRRLERLYGGPAPYAEKLDQRETLFLEALDDFGRLKPAFQTDRYTGFGAEPLNNAYLSAVGLYHRHFHLFERVLQEKDHSIPRLLAFLRGLAETEGEMLEKMKGGTATDPPGTTRTGPDGGGGSQKTGDRSQKTEVRNRNPSRGKPRENPQS